MAGLLSNICIYILTTLYFNLQKAWISRIVFQLNNNTALKSISKASSQNIELLSVFWQGLFLISAASLRAITSIFFKNNANKISTNMVFIRVFDVLTTLFNKAKFTCSRSKSPKAQEILERNCGVFNFLKTQRNIFPDFYPSI